MSDGLCQCGCGSPTPLASQTARGLVKGQPRRYLTGYHRRSAPQTRAMAA